MTNRILVWDLTTRIIHWLLTIAFAGAMGIAFFVDDDSQFFQNHMLLGMVASFLVVLRIIWGVVGTRYARFGSFLFSPKALFEYLRSSFRHADERFTGHNPGSGYATFAIIILTFGLAFTGIFMSKWGALHDVHEIIAYLMATTLIVHILGVAWYTIRHRENITLGMIDGKKQGLASEAIFSSRPLLGLVFLALTAGWVFLVFQGHDPQTKKVNLLGQTIHLGEHEGDHNDDHDD